jgi:16S rRNA (guanine1207-N2)-methyltransferase
MEHYFTSKQKSTGKEFIINFNFHSINFKFLSSKGVFSKKKIDKGTIVLLKNVSLLKNSKVLDLGCGYGAIGIVIAKLYPNSSITMVEINKRAFNLAKKNVKLNKVKNVNVMYGNLYEPIQNKKFDLIVSNPPISAGLSVCYKIIEKAKEHLNERGRLQIVARKKKGGNRLMEKMIHTFGNCKIIGKEKGYYVYQSEKLKNIEIR